MKRLVKSLLLVPVTVLAMFASVSAQAGFVNIDGSEKSNLCIVATQSEAAFKKEMDAMSLSAADLASFSCNGFPIDRFAEQYRGKVPNEEVKVFAFSNKTKNTAAKICIAGATSNKALKKAMKAAKLPKQSAYLVKCDGKTLKVFAKEYGNKRFRL